MYVKSFLHLKNRPCKGLLIAIVSFVVYIEFAGGHEMEIGKQIRKFRMQMEFSQDQLAMKIYVSRQTISNWENNKNYPDVKSLLLLSSLFNVSLDQLVKGDVEEMKQVINAEVMKRFKKDSSILTILFIVMLCSAVPLFLLLKKLGAVIWLGLAIAALYYANRIEGYKKKHDIHTYKEIVNFLEGKSLDEMERQQEFGKRPYQRVLLAAGGAIIALIIAGGMLLMIDKFL